MLFESIRQVGDNPGLATAKIIIKKDQLRLPWVLIRENNACYDITLKSDFNLLLQLDTNMLQNGKKIVVKII